MYQDRNDAYTYRNYTLDISLYDISLREKSIVDNAIDLVEYGWSLSELSRNCEVPKSTLQRQFQTDLRWLSFELYQLVQKRYKEHLNHTKG